MNALILQLMLPPNVYFEAVLVHGKENTTSRLKKDKDEFKILSDTENKARVALLRGLY